MNVSHPLVQSVLVPLAVALAVGVALRRPAAGRLGAAAGGCGLLAALALLVGFDAWPPPSTTARLAWLCAAALLAGVALEFAAAAPRQRAALFLPGLAAALVWLALPRLEAGGVAVLAECAVALALSLAIGARWALRPPPAVEASGALAVLAAALAVVAFNGGSLLIAQLALALCVGAAVQALLAFGGGVASFGAAGLFSGLAGALLLVTLTLLLTDASRAALLVLALLPFADLLSRRLPVAGGRWRRPATLAWMLAACALPAAAAIALSSATPADAGLYYQ